MQSPPDIVSHSFHHYPREYTARLNFRSNTIQALALPVNLGYSEILTLTFLQETACEPYKPWVKVDA